MPSATRKTCVALILAAVVGTVAAGEQETLPRSEVRRPEAVREHSPDRERMSRPMEAHRPIDCSELNKIKDLFEGPTRKADELPTRGGEGCVANPILHRPGHTASDRNYTVTLTPVPLALPLSTTVASTSGAPAVVPSSTLLDVEKRARRVTPTRSAPKQAESVPPADIQLQITSVPARVTLNQPFTFNVELLSGPKEADLAFDRNEGVSFTPSETHMRQGERTSIEARVLQAPLGLARLIATAGGREFRMTLNAGFAANAKLDLMGPVESGSTRQGEIVFYDSNGTRGELGGSAAVTLEGAGLQFENGDSWTDRITIPLSKGASSTGLFTIRAQRLPGPGRIVAQFSVADEQAASSTTFDIAVGSSAFQRAAMGVLGGLLCAAYQLLRVRRHSIKGVLVRICGGVVAGLAAYIFSETNLLGIKVDTASLRTFVVLGFLVAYFGLDTLLRATFPKHAKAD